MASMEQKIATLQPLLDELEPIRAERERLGAMHTDSIRDPLKRERANLDYREAVATDKEASEGAIKTINDFDEEIVTPFDKAIMARVVTEEYRSSDTTIVEDIVRGISTFGRLRTLYDLPPEPVLFIEKDAVSLFQSQGVEDLVTKSVFDNMLGIYFKLKDGVKVTSMLLKSERFPDVIVSTDATYSEPLFTVPRPSFHDMDKAIEAAENDQWPFVRLGTKAKPVDTAPILQSDEQRFAFRLAKEFLKDGSWLSAPEPSTEFRDKYIKAFAEVFSDILIGQEPRDDRDNYDSSWERRQSRAKPLGSYTTQELDVSYSAAGVEAEDVITATKEELDKIATKKTANSIRASFIASQVIDSFFEQLFSS